MERKKYDKKLPFAITKRQDEKLEEIARRCKITKAEVIRRLIDGTALMDHESFLLLRNLTMEIHKIGININQIAKNNNSYLYNTSDKVILMKEIKRINQDLEHLAAVLTGGGERNGHHEADAYEGMQ